MSDKSDSKPAEAPSPIGEISQEPSALESFLDANQKKLVIIGILAILILVGYVVYDGLRKMGIENDAAAVSAAKTVPEYEKVLQELDSPNPKGSALLLKSQLLWEDKQKDEAIAALDEFISTYPEHPALGSAYASLGSYQQQLGKLPEAKAAFEKSAETKSAASSLALLSLGDLARQAGEDDKAKAFYEQIISEYETSHFQVKGLARQRIELIGVKSPVEKAPEPIKAPTPPKPGAFSDPVAVPGLPPVKPTETPAEDPTTPDTPADTPAPAETPADTETPETPTEEPGEPTPPAEDPAEPATETPAPETPGSE